MLWKLNRIQYPIYNLGSGIRIAIWVQGCTLACKSCISPSLHNPDKGKEIKVQELANQILKVKDHFTGISITGGEPFQQYTQLIAFCAFIKEHSNLEIYVFTGYYLEELYKLFPDKLFIKFIDYLLDGRYEIDNHDNNNARGSSNQCLYRFKEGKAIEETNYFSSDEVSFQISNDNQIFLSGIPKKNDLNYLSDFLKESGIDLIFK